MPSAAGSYDYGVDSSNLNTTYGLIMSLVPEGSRVLDLGCASGNLARALENERHCEVLGVELDPDAARAASAKGLQVLVADIVQVPLGELLAGRTFDRIVLADVLEHLGEPLRTLSQTRRLLSPGGRVLTSFPNITHIDIQLMLAQDQWRYVPAGILDRTHLRFFTLASFTQMAASAGFEVTTAERVHHGPLATEVLEHGDRLALGTEEVETLVRLNHLNPNLDVYQYVLELTPRAGGEAREAAPTAASGAPREAPSLQPPGLTVILPHPVPGAGGLKEALYSLVGVAGADLRPLVVAPERVDQAGLESLVGEASSLLPSLRLVRAPGESGAELLNQALDRVETEYVAFLPPGIVLYPTFAERLLGRLRAAPASLAAYGAVQLAAGEVVGDAFVVRERLGLRAGSFDRARLYVDDYIDLGGLVAATAALRELGLRFRPELREQWGWGFVCDLARHGSLVSTDSVVAERRLPSAPPDRPLPRSMHPLLEASLGSEPANLSVAEAAAMGARMLALEEQAGRVGRDRAELERVLQSRSWRMTRLLRRLTRSRLPG